jgi:hypothetical protein
MLSNSGGTAVTGPTCGTILADVDRTRHLTTYTRDQNGNARSSQFYGTALTGAITTATVPTGTPASNPALDQQMSFTFDRLGQQKTATLTASGTTVTLTYNGLGEVVSKQEPSRGGLVGDLTTYSYDALGRLTEAKIMAYNIYVGASVTEAEKTVFSYDGAGTQSLVSHTIQPRNVTPGSWPAGATLPIYIVQAGDTLQSIANALWGSELSQDVNTGGAGWSQIRSANSSLANTASNTVLPTGLQLNIPTHVIGGAAAAPTGLPTVLFDADGNVLPPPDGVDPDLYAESVRQHSVSTYSFLQSQAAVTETSAGAGRYWDASQTANAVTLSTKVVDADNAYLSAYYSGLATTDTAHAAEYTAAKTALSDNTASAHNIDAYATQISVPPPSKHGGCGAILLGVLGIVLAIALPFAAPGVFGAGALGGLGPVLGAVTANVVTQGIGIATGLQDKFNFGAVALSAIGAGVGSGLGALGNGGTVGGFLNDGSFIGDVARGALGSAITQGIGVATGLQKRFDWVGVAAAGVASGVGGAVSRSVGGAAQAATATTDAVQASFTNTAISAAAGGIAGAATRSVIEGSDFGRNLVDVLPDVIGSTIGRLVAAQIAGRAIGEAKDVAIKTAEKAAGASAASGTVGSARLRYLTQAQDQYGNPIDENGNPIGGPTGGRVSDDSTEASLSRLDFSTPGNGSRSRDYIATNGDIVIEAIRAPIHGLGWRIADALGAHQGGFLYNAFNGAPSVGEVGSYLYQGTIGPDTSVGRYIIKPVDVVFYGGLGLIANSPAGDPGTITTLETSGVPYIVAAGQGLAGVRGLAELGGALRVTQSVRTLSVAVDPLAIATGRLGQTGNAYSVAFETKLSLTSFPGVSRGAHYQEANKALLQAMEGDAAFASDMQGLGVNLQRTPTGLAPRTSPTDFTWHHAQEPGVIQLVPRSQHAPGSIFQDVLHPNGQGGYSIWGK